MQRTNWAIDPTHSEIEFKIRHMISHVTGSFSQYDAQVSTEGEDITTLKVHFTAEVSSIDTKNEQRDQHLRSGDFFDAANHPQVIFDSEKVEKGSGEEYKLYGTLNMRGVSKPIVLDVTYEGIMKDPWGNTRAGFTVTGKISRKEWGVSFSVLSDTGNILLSDDVSITCSVQFTKVQVAEPAAAATA